MEAEESSHVLDLPGGERLRIRPVRPGDADALQRLFRSLDAEGRHRRFFTAAGPPADYCEHLANIAERGGVGIVAVELPGDRIVAEADAEPLPDGNGEIGVTVARRWRGWLGPYLLGLLRRQAAGRGMRNLEAEILAGNLPMRALTRSCGEALLPQRDWQTVRVVFGTEGTAPSWPVSTGDAVVARPSVLVELRTMGVEPLTGLEEAGYDVLACTGRTSSGPPCPMRVEGGDCPLARHADVVVVALADGAERDVLTALHRHRHPAVPVVTVEVGPGHPMTAAVLAAAAESGLAGRPPTAPAAPVAEVSGSTCPPSP